MGPRAASGAHIPAEPGWPVGEVPGNQSFQNQGVLPSRAAFCTIFTDPFRPMDHPSRPLDPVLSDVVEYRPDLNVLLCLRCNHAVGYNALEWHLGHVHHIRAPRLMAMIRQAPPESHCCNGKHTAYHPANGGPPIPGLPPPVDGVVCTECGYACRNAATMRRHVKQQHPTLHAPDNEGMPGRRPWEGAQMQTLYIDLANIHYFTVVPAADSPPSLVVLPTPESPPGPEQVGDCMSARVWGWGGRVRVRVCCASCVDCRRQSWHPVRNPARKPPHLLAQAAASTGESTPTDWEESTDDGAAAAATDDSAAPAAAADDSTPATRDLARRLDFNQLIEQCVASVRRPAPVVDTPVDRADLDPWIAGSKFDEHLKGLERADILAATAPLPDPRRGRRGPDPPEDEEKLEVFRRVAAATQDLLGPGFVHAGAMSDLDRYALANFEGQPTLPSKMFKAKQQPQTVARYIQEWVRFLLYVLRVVWGEHLPAPEGCPKEGHLFSLTGQQRKLLGKVFSIAAFLPEGQPNEELQRVVLELSLAFLRQRTSANMFESAVASYCAARGIQTGLRWRCPNSHRSIIMTMVACAQVRGRREGCLAPPDPSPPGTPPTPRPTPPPARSQVLFVLDARDVLEAHMSTAPGGEDVNPKRRRIAPPPGTPASRPRQLSAMEMASLLGSASRTASALSVDELHALRAEQAVRFGLWVWGPEGRVCRSR
jgi:Orsellinic acid/F9775 biosynthesis cluster protein D